MLGNNTGCQLGAQLISTNPIVNRRPREVVAVSEDPWPVVLPFVDVAQVALGAGHTCALKRDGTLWCWGDNGLGQLGVGSWRVERLCEIKWPVEARGPDVAQVSAGGDHTCAVKRDGTLWCWGWNADGELGDGTTTDRNRPVQVTALGDAVAEVSAGVVFTCARLVDGTVWCWGRNHFDPSSSRDTPFSDPQRIEGLEGRAAGVSAGSGHTCSLQEDGSVWCWGSGVRGELGDGTCRTTGFPVHIATLGSSVVHVSTGTGDHTCVLRDDGTVWCWGDNVWGQVGDGTTLERRGLPSQVLYPCP